ncbi:MULTISPECIES: monovalent cation/H+ antiporter complex subunit F [unclassified Streptomyces]|uniref:monovalent cation/H+ antiporter complex subunit F n=1 Tax=unclassified Streptomyces TaxID=2593676 RepID=UPI0008DEA5FA|nr:MULTISPECIES: monovalent cation/H+ antiporter complex subunit F [unclassified Streptomyces]OII69698.1 sodium:proton antiporter [Streptomyces sp. CC77]
MTVALHVALGVLVASGLLILVRMLLGPAALDRIVALDVLASVIIAGTTVHMALWRDPTPLPVLVVLALLAFIGSVTAAHLVERREGMR